MKNGAINKKYIEDLNLDDPKLENTVELDDLESNLLSSQGEDNHL